MQVAEHNPFQFKRKASFITLTPAAGAVGGKLKRKATTRQNSYRCFFQVVAH